jgi:ABC-type multidrug transport system fused ATPase/permease subunit
VILQAFLGFLDLVGVALVGILGSLAITGASSRTPGDRVSQLLSLLRLENLNLQSQAFVVGLTAASVLVIKTILSAYFNRRITFFLSRRGAVISARLVSKLLQQPITKLQSRSMQETLYTVTTGVDAITMGILSTSIQLSADASLLVLLTVGLFVVDPTVAFSTLFLFATAALVLHRSLSVRARRLGVEEAALGILNSSKTLEVLNSYRELVVRNRRGYYARELGNIRLKQANNRAESAIMPNISKYVLELTLVIGSLLISAIQFKLHSAAHAVAVLSVFIVTSSRIAPAVLRMQQGLLRIRNNLGSAERTLDLHAELGYLEVVDEFSDEVQTEHQDFVPHIKVVNATFQYPDSNSLAIDNLSLEIMPGEIVAFVGPSGAGKSTLVDLILGILSPDAGSIVISGEVPLSAIKIWPGAIGYVPQNVVIADGTIHGNVSMGFPVQSKDEPLVNSAIHIAQLKDYVDSLPKGIHSAVGDGGAKMSGGQKQRLGIARAMFTKPLLLILDEATSSLDGETEANVSEAIQAMRGNVTVILIAHRLSTVMQADSIYYLESGKLRAKGKFNEMK